MEAVTRKGGLLYPMLVIAAIAVIVFSVTGIATMLGWLPGALSERSSAPKLERPAPRSEIDNQRSGPDAPAANVSRPVDKAQAAPPSPAACIHCGVIESIRPVEARGESSWLGAAGGAVVGGLLGNQIGSGRVNEGKQPRYAVGQKVRATDRGIRPAG